MRSTLLAVLALLAVLVAPHASAQDGSRRAVEDLRATLVDDESQEARDAVALLDQAQAEYAQLDELERATSDFKNASESAKGRIEALSKELAEPPSTDPPKLEGDPKLADVQALATQADADLVAARAALAAIDEEARLRKARQTAIPEEVSQLQQEIDSRNQALAGLKGTDPVSEARALLLRAQIDVLQARIRRSEAERDSYQARRDLLPLRRDRAQRDVTSAQIRADFYAKRIEQMRKLEAEDALGDADALRKELEGTVEPLEKLAQRQYELTELLSGKDGVSVRLAEESQKLRDLRERRAEVVRRSNSTRTKVAVGGMTSGIGDLLRRDLDWLDEPSILRARSRERADQLSEVQLRLIELEEERDSFGDVGSRQLALREAMSRAMGAASATYDAVAEKLVSDQRRLLDRLIGEYESLIDVLVEQGAIDDVVAKESNRYRTYIEERVLWFPSSPRGSWRDLGALRDAALWIVTPKTWTDAWNSLLEGLRQQPWRGIAALVLVLAWAVLQRRLRRVVVDVGAASRSFRTDRHALTWRALAATLLRVALVPAALVVVAHLPELDPDATDNAFAVSEAVVEGAWIAFVLALVREVCLPKGVGETLFRWPTAQLAAIRRRITWFGPGYVLCIALAAAFGGTATDNWGEALGRVPFVIGQLVLFAALRRTFSDLSLWTREEDAATSIASLGVRRTWLTLVLAAPLVWVLMSFLGYGYAARMLEGYYRLSLLLGLAVLLFDALLSRWLFVARRRLAIQRAQQRLAQRTEDDENAGAARESGTIAEADLDLPAIDAQTRQFFRSLLVVVTVLGLYSIWSAGLPAVRMLDRFTVWPDFGRVLDVSQLDESASSKADVVLQAPGSSAPSTSAPSSPSANAFGAGPASMVAAAAEEAAAESHSKSRVSAADVILTLIVLLLTAVAAKNVPGLLEITILKRLPLDGGARNALATLSRYLILIVGTSAAFGSLGVGWEKVQWLAAAFTFGLAFGLQEVFANFVSGLIILLERPVRVGDIVSVSGLEGRVTRIQMRATTILDWDRRELLVPNKEFITQSVINWTLSDPTTRVVIPVGVAYGSDTGLVHELLLRCAKENPLVLEQPAPQALFRHFGESSLDFELRVFIGNRDLWPELIDKLHSEIDRIFREHDVEISFPQRDLHIRTAPGLSGIFGRGKGGDAAAEPS
ncbi:MAG: mechanosensitive ion channel [Planctomycetota bacterium]